MKPAQSGSRMTRDLLLFKGVSEIMAISSFTLGSCFGVDGKQAQQQYIWAYKRLSQLDLREHTLEWSLYEASSWKRSTSIK